MSWCLAPLAAAFLSPPALAFWVESHRFRLPFTDALRAVISDYSRPLSDSLWVTTFYQLPPFLLLAVALGFLARRLAARHIALVCFVGLTLIFLIQVPMTIRVLKRIPDGEAEFAQILYVGVSLVSGALVGFGLLFTRRLLPNEPGNA
jgi:hypothetical protein